MSYAEKRPNGRYRAVYRDAEGKKRYAGTFAHKRAAIAAAARAEEESRKPGWRDPQAAGKTWGEWEQAWQSMHEVALATSKAEASFLDKHIRPRWEDVRLADITKGDVLAWAKLLATPKEVGGAGLAASSVSRIVAVFRTSLQAAIDQEVLTYNPATRLKLPKPALADPKFLTLEEANALIAELTGRDRFIVELMFGTGLRIGEVAGLRPVRVSMEGARVTVRETWSSSARVLNPVPKGKAERTVPVPPGLRDRLLHLAQTAEHDMVFYPRIDANNWRNRVWNPAVERAGLVGATPHDCRHTYGSWLLQGGLPIAEIARLMGHTDAEVTRIYARLADHPTDAIFSALETGGRGRGGQLWGQTSTPNASKAIFGATSQDQEKPGQSAISA